MKKVLTKLLINSGVVSVREGPFVYSSGNRGPGYIMIKDLVGRQSILDVLIDELVYKLEDFEVDFINGNATGGMIPGYELSKRLDKPFVYMRGTRKAGGHNEMVVGLDGNPLIPHGSSVLIVEELVNYAETTINAVKIFRGMGYECKYAACILSYDTEETQKRLKEEDITLISVITLSELLNIAKEEGYLDNSLVNSYLEYLKDPIEWQISRGLALPEMSAFIAKSRGYRITKLSKEDQLIPDCKRDFTYYQISKNPFIWLALDHDIQHNISLFDSIEGNFGYKINLDELLFNDFNISAKRPLFLDLKMWNGLETMRRTLQKVVKIPQVKVVNIYTHAGVDALSTLVKEFPSLEIYTLTVLTHYDEQYCKEIYKCTMDVIIENLINIAKKSGCVGVIVPTNFVILAHYYGLKTIVPGVRINGAINSEDSIRQKQIGLIKECIGDAIVVGREVTKAENPLERLKEML